MARTKPLAAVGGEVPPLTDAELRTPQPAGTLPAGLQPKLGARGPHRSPTKERITIYL